MLDSASPVAQLSPPSCGDAEVPEAYPAERTFLNPCHYPPFALLKVEDKNKRTRTTLGVHFACAWPASPANTASFSVGECELAA